MFGNNEKRKNFWVWLLIAVLAVLIYTSTANGAFSLDVISKRTPFEIFLRLSPVAFQIFAVIILNVIIKRTAKGLMSKKQAFVYIVAVLAATLLEMFFISQVLNTFVSPYDS